MVDEDNKLYGGDKYEYVHTPIQYTSSCRIQTVNTRNQCLYRYKIKERAADDNKKVWNIEMDNARDFTLLCTTGLALFAT